MHTIIPYLFPSIQKKTPAASWLQYGMVLVPQWWGSIACMSYVVCIINSTPVIHPPHGTVFVLCGIIFPWGLTTVASVIRPNIILMGQHQIIISRDNSTCRFSDRCQHHHHYRHHPTSDWLCSKSSTGIIFISWKQNKNTLLFVFVSRNTKHIPN